MFDKWCITSKAVDKSKRLWKLTEKEGGRSAIMESLCEAVRSHYDSLENISDDIAELGYPLAAENLKERMPTKIRGRSGELGEILASEIVEQQIGYRIPVKRIRYKDGREMALRGDDFIGVNTDGAIKLLKGESKSRALLGAATVSQARAALDRDNGRCTPTSLLFLCDRLMERGGAEADLGRKIRNLHAKKSFKPEQIEHMLFTFSGNEFHPSLQTDFHACDPSRPQTSVHLRVEDHKDFINFIYEEAAKLGTK